ncbi:BEN domain-containing protein 2 [Eptesicus fuscus]|uniref:BEN domain-containing protein 2 n=1 Tax=Eptesicus fuscus TaxID=29078 RepID=UPI002403EB06|nr:BEN domain-containing protein 2 [Eptesicus fuscus]
MMNNPQFLGNNKGGQNMPRVIILSNEGYNARNNMEVNTQITSNRHVLGNNSGARDIPRVLIFCDDEGGKAQNNWEKNTQTTNNRQMLGNNSGGRDTRVLTLCNDEMNKTQFKQEENSQMMNKPAVLGNNNGGQDTPRVLIHSHDSSTEIKSETTSYPISMKNEIKEEDIDSGSYFITPGYGYLGDPKRKVTIPRMHLVTAQRKPEPKHAARYLARNLFSREVLLCSTASTNLNLPSSSGRQPLDPNIMAALREYLITIFPNHDLRECGKDWRACISYVNALIRYLSSASKKYQQKPVVLTKRSIPASVDLDDKKDADGGEGSSLLYRQAAASETSASGNSQPKRSAISEGFENPSTSASMLPYRALCYIGNPTRNVQVSYLVLTIAKKKACPQMAASYLIGQLFPEDVLLNSSVYGNLWHGVCALNYSRISAIREFLQDIYPACDLSEGGRDWKMCVNSMNHYIRTLKPGYRNFTFESSSSEISSSSKSESSDTDLSD